MLQCLFYVNDLLGGEAHHDGGMKGRDAAKVLPSPMPAPAETAARDALARGRRASWLPPRAPAKGHAESHADRRGSRHAAGSGEVDLPRAGTEARTRRRAYPVRCSVVSADLNPSTRLEKAVKLLPAGHHFEMSIEEQAATLLTDGLSYSSRTPQLNVFSTFAAFLEGIAREGFEMWRYQRNLSGHNEGLNVLIHFAHVGACTGRDHFSGWSLDWINLALGYMPYLRHFYAPADARSAFVAVRDAAAGYGGHIVAIPRDNLPVLTKDDGKTPLWNAGDAWEPVTTARGRSGAKTAILTIGAPSYLAVEASDKAAAAGVLADVHIVNGFPLPESFLEGLPGRYERIITLEDGVIGTVEAGLRGFAAYVAGKFASCGARVEHLGIVDPTIAPSETFLDVWAPYRMQADAIAARLK